MDIAEIDKMLKENEDLKKENTGLKSEVEKWIDGHARWERDQYNSQRVNDFISLIFGNIIFFGCLEILRIIVMGWWENDLLNRIPSWQYWTIMLIYYILLIQGIVRFVWNLRDLFWDELEWLGKFVNAGGIGALWYNGITGAKEVAERIGKEEERN